PARFHAEPAPRCDALARPRECFLGCWHSLRPARDLIFLALPLRAGAVADRARRVPWSARSGRGFVPETKAGRCAHRTPAGPIAHAARIPDGPDRAADRPNVPPTAWPASGNARPIRVSFPTYRPAADPAAIQARPSIRIPPFRRRRILADHRRFLRQ